MNIDGTDKGTRFTYGANRADERAFAFANGALDLAKDASVGVVRTVREKLDRAFQSFARTPSDRVEGSINEFSTWLFGMGHGSCYAGTFCTTRFVDGKWAWTAGRGSQTVGQWILVDVRNLVERHNE